MTVSFDTPLDLAAILRAPDEVKLAAMQAFHIHCDPAFTQETRDGAGRAFYRYWLRFVRTDIRPN